MFWFVLSLFVLIVRGNAEVTTTAQPEASEAAITADATTTETSQAASTVTATVNDQPLTTVGNTGARVIEPFTGLAHGISSGKIMIIGNNTFHIPNFHFDGTAPQAHFLVGKGDKISPEGGTFVHLDNGSEQPLPKYDGQDVKLTLPDGITTSDIDWLAVWCIEYTLDLGHVFINKKVDLSSPQTFSLANEVTSGPIILVNKKTLFIPNFRYNGDRQNVHFWVGNGSEPSSQGVQIPDEEGSSNSLHSYQGQSITLNLPEGISTDNIEYFGVWSIDEGLSLGYVSIKGITGIPEATMQKLDILTMRLPKCCPESFVLTINGCEKMPSLLLEPTFDVYEHNDTHFRNESLELNRQVKFEFYTFAPECKHGKYPLDEDTEEFALLKNFSLLVKGAVVTGILPTDSFCIENIWNETASNVKILVCVPEQKMQMAMFVTYVTFTIISTFCFAITFFLYTFWLKIEDVHRKCFTAYVFFMMITFLSLTIVQTANVENGGCEVLGFFFQFSMIASFTLLGILCVDILIIIKYIDENMLRRRRKICYLVVGLAVPILSLIISLARNLTPDVPNSFFKPQYQKNACYFEAESQRTLYFYIPITISMIVSLVFLGWTKKIIINNDRNCINNYFWLEKGTLYKFMWRKHVIVVLTSFMWFIETVIHLNYANANMLMAIDIVEASQGVIVLLLFAVNKETRKEVVKRIKVRKKKNNDSNILREEDLMLM